MLVVRVPAQQFYAALDKLETLGQVSDRYVRAQDVTDAFRDLEMRLRNAEAVRDRLVKLLDKAPDVPQSLEVERELDRITERIELLKGQLKSMGDRIAFSTITIRFQAKRDEVINPEFQLPFEWLRQPRTPTPAVAAFAMSKTNTIATLVAFALLGAGCSAAAAHDAARASSSSSRSAASSTTARRAPTAS